MTITVPHDARREWLTALAVGVLVLATVVLLIGSARAQERTGDPAKWRNYWTQLYTVFTHPRCLNCHGATDIESGDNHGGGPLDDGFSTRCFECHTANTVLTAGRCENGFVRGPDDEPIRENPLAFPCVPGDEPGEIRVPVGATWGGRGPSFVGLDMRTLCLEVKAAMGPETLLTHVREDPLIGFAFEGRRAIADGQFGPVDADPPRMSKEEFVGVLLRWIGEAAMACSTDGTVALTDNVMLDSAPSPFGRTQVRNAIDAKVAIEREVATSDLRYDETSSLVFRPVAPGCSPTSTGEVHFTAEGKPGANYEIQIGPNSTYRMRFLLGSIEGKSDIVYREELCRPPSGWRESLDEPATELRFGLDEWHTAEQDRSKLILRGSTTIPNDFVTGGSFISGGERKITWDIVIQ
jgi:hypothetical protein